jgi:Taurine catabolism dioxygenase TauD, TfdA family
VGMNLRWSLTCAGHTCRLLCLHNAKEGGHSSWTSSVSVHNRILELAPDLARTLAQRGAWYFDRKVRLLVAVSRLQGRA